MHKRQTSATVTFYRRRGFPTHHDLRSTSWQILQVQAVIYWEQKPLMVTRALRVRTEHCRSLKIPNHFKAGDNKVTGEPQTGKEDSNHYIALRTIHNEGNS